LQSSQELSRKLGIYLMLRIFVCVTDCKDCLHCVCIQEVIVQPMDIVRVLIEVSYDVFLS